MNGMFHGSILTSGALFGSRLAGLYACLVCPLRPTPTFLARTGEDLA